MSNVKRKNTVQNAAAGAADVSRRVICGGVAGMVAKTATAPLERIKMLSQTGAHRLSSSSSSTSILSIYRSILQNEGLLGLWAGNGANLLRIFPAKGVVFSANDLYRTQISRLTNQKKLSGGWSFLAGGLSGMTASAATYPLDLARGRMSGTMARKGGKVYGGIWGTLTLTVREEGVAALFKGMTPTLLGAVPYEGIKFGTVGLLEVLFPVEEEGGGGGSGVMRKVLFGGAGGVMAGLITYPNDTVRRMLQLQGSREAIDVYTGYWDCVRKVYKRYGIVRFYHGVTINLIRMAPNTAVQFGTYELLKRLTADMW